MHSVDPRSRATATVKWFYLGNRLYLGFDVRDQIVQYCDPAVMPEDGFIVTLNDYAARSSSNHQLMAYRYTFQVGPTGHAQPWMSCRRSSVPTARRSRSISEAASPLDTLGRTVSDIGYTAEMWIDLTKIGYPAGLGDRHIFLGMRSAGRRLVHPTGPDSYSARVWWQREHAGGSGADGGSKDGPAWGYLDPGLQGVSAFPSPAPEPVGKIELLDVSPEPVHRPRPRSGSALAASRATCGSRCSTCRAPGDFRDFGHQPVGTCASSSRPQG